MTRRTDDIIITPCFMDRALLELIQRVEDAELKKRLCDSLLLIKKEWFQVFNHSSQFHEACRVINDFRMRHHI